MGRNARYSVRHFLHVFLSFRLVNNPRRFRPVRQTVTEAPWPGLVKHMEPCGPSKSTASRSRNYVDNALLLHSQEGNENHSQMKSKSVQMRPFGFFSHQRRELVNQKVHCLQKRRCEPVYGGCARVGFGQGIPFTGH